MLNKAKKALEAKEAEVKGQKWLAEVKDGSGQWKGLEHWKEKYEPKKEKKEDSEMKKVTKEKAEEKGLDIAFKKMQEGISKGLLKVILEVSSTLLGKACQIAKDPFVPKVLSSMNGIILSYRFSTEKKARKFAFIRKEACGDLAKILEDLLPSKRPSEITIDLQELFQKQKIDIRTVIKQKVDLLLAFADNEIDTKMKDAEGQVDALKLQADAAIGMAKDEVGEEKLEAINSQGEALTGLKAPDINVLPDKALVKGQKDDVVAQFGGMFKDLLVHKMDQIDEWLGDYVEKFMTALEMAIKLQGQVAGQESKSQDELRDETVTVVENLYAEAQQQLGQEVQKVLVMLRAMIFSAAVDDDEAEGEE
jgi:hypothetical protein